MWFLGTALKYRKLWWSLVMVATFAFYGSNDLKAQDPQFTQFYANPLYLNPAFAGTNHCPRIVLNYRNQWPALSGTFVTYSASYDQHVDAISGGLGLLVTSDQAGKGTLNTTTISGIYSYTQNINRKFSIKAGLQATYFQKSLDWNKLTFGDMIDPRRGFIFQTNDVPRDGNVSNVDFTAGLLGYSEIFFVGFAAHHITEPNESLIVGTSKLPMKFTVHAGAAIPMKKGRYQDNATKISPQIVYQQQADFSQLNIGLYVDKGPIVAGVWYRNEDSFIVLIGLQSDHFKFGYSYDVTTSKLTTATAGSHEISTQILLDCKPKHRRFKVIPCPSL